MPTRMLIDARHREETRVAVVKKSRIEEFDFESEEHKQLKGNIYLAKVTRVEPSLQAAFVDYGGNRHGFLAFSEIHPDYYQIPKSDRDKLLAEEAEHAREEAERREKEDEKASSKGQSSEDEPEIEETGDADADEAHEDEPSVQNIRKKRMDLRRRYKIQDVIHRRQVLLVQVVKEERGNKGAALTTYLSLAGRYCVLMPNTSHGGGISRKISNASDRKRLKEIVDELNLPQTMGCIIRTAGMTRTKAEIKRDFTYLARLWDEIREGTLKATAPEKIYTDSDLVKRAIRDIYNREIDEVVVEGADGYKAAKDFMKLLMPSHARRVKQYADATPLFQRYQVEDQLAAMYQPLVQLKSGGYLVINPTEALVSIDINSGRSTREHNIEQTALKTNIEAAKEIARQLRLRDMAGLVVIDFIDMDHHSNNRKVEKALKDALKHDRARIQVGRISSFGLLEMSRQRLRTGVLEASTVDCPHCEGTGLMRTASSAGLSALRLLEEEAAKGKGSELSLSCSRDAAVYVLNSKRAELGEIEERYGVSIEVLPDRNLEGAAMELDVSGPAPEKPPAIEAPLVDEDDEEDEDEIEAEADEEERAEESKPKSKSSRRRRGRRGGRSRGRRSGAGGDDAEGKAEAGKSAPEDKREAPPQDEPGQPQAEGDAAPEDAAPEDAGSTGKDEPETKDKRSAKSSSGKSRSKSSSSRSRSRGKSGADASDKPATNAEQDEQKAGKQPESGGPDTPASSTGEADGDKPATSGKPSDEPSGEPETVGAESDAQSGPPRRGWWQRTFGE